MHSTIRSWPADNQTSNRELLSEKRQQAEALIAAVEALRRNAQVQRAAALIAGTDDIARNAMTDTIGHNGLPSATEAEHPGAVSTSRLKL